MMKLSNLKMHWTPEEALTVLAFFEELQSIISNAYGKEINNYYQNEFVEKQADTDDNTLEEDSIHF